MMQNRRFLAAVAENPRHPMTRDKVLLLAIITLAFLLRVTALDSQSLWGDETFSVAVASLRPLPLLEIALVDKVHPPLYYLLLHVWLPIGQQEFCVRFFSVVSGCLCVAMTYALGKTIDGPRLGAISSFLLALSPFHVWYSQETRMYSLAMLLTVAAAYLFVKCLEDCRKRTMVLFILVSSLAAYTTYAYVLVLLAQGYFLLSRRRRLKTPLWQHLLSLAAVSLALSPWLILVFTHGGFYDAGLSWIPAVGPADLFFTLYNFSVGQTSDPTNIINLASAAVFCVVSGYGLLALYRSANHERIPEGGAYLAYWALLPLLVVFVVSINWPIPLKRSIYHDRFLSLLMPPFLLAAGRGLLHLQRKNNWLAALLAVLVFGTRPPALGNLYAQEVYWRQDLRRAIQFIRETARPGDVLLIMPTQLPSYLYYSPGEMLWGLAHTTDLKPAWMTYWYPQLPAQTRVSWEEAKRIWMLQKIGESDAHHFMPAPPTLEPAKTQTLRAWLDQNRKLVKVYRFRLLVVLLYTT